MPLDPASPLHEKDADTVVEAFRDFDRGFVAGVIAAHGIKKPIDKDYVYALGLLVEYQAEDHK